MAYPADYLEYLEQCLELYSVDRTATRTVCTVPRLAARGSWLLRRIGKRAGGKCLIYGISSFS